MLLESNLGFLELEAMLTEAGGDKRAVSGVVARNAVRGGRGGRCGRGVEEYREGWRPRVWKMQLQCFGANDAAHARGSRTGPRE